RRRDRHMLLSRLALRRERHLRRDSLVARRTGDRSRQDPLRRLCVRRTAGLGMDLFPTRGQGRERPGGAAAHAGLFRRGCTSRPRDTPASAAARPPRMPVFSDEAAPAAAIMLPFPCSTDHAAFGLMDPTHAGFVHTSWWFKHQPTKLRPKEKQFEPIELGWRM